MVGTKDRRAHKAGLGGHMDPVRMFWIRDIADLNAPSKIVQQIVDDFRQGSYGHRFRQFQQGIQDENAV